ncbi:MAG: DUF202 domain-containing protein [Gammaproteobacteria bacterium]
MTDQKPGHDQQFTTGAAVDSHFAWIRTRLSAERTMMAWIRTAVALIGFGFTIVQFFERVAGFANHTAAVSNTPRYVGLFLIGAGIVVIAVSVWQYRAFLNYMWDAPFASIRVMGKVPGETPVYVISIGLIFVGLFAFVAVYLQL